MADYKYCIARLAPAPIFYERITGMLTEDEAIQMLSQVDDPKNYIVLHEGSKQVQGEEFLRGRRLPYFAKFTFKKIHVLLLQNMLVKWGSSGHSVTYGTGNINDDILGLLGETKQGDCWTEAQIQKAKAAHREMAIALQVFLQHASLPEKIKNEYIKPEYSDDWQLDEWVQYVE